METTVTSNGMLNAMNSCAMNYTSLLEQRTNMALALQELDALIKAKRKEDIENLTRAYVTAMMGAYQTSMEELNENLTHSIQELSGNVFTTTTSAVDDQTLTALPESAEENISEMDEITEPEEENKIESKSGSIFDDPAFQELYNPLVAEEVDRTQDIKTPSPETDEELPTMDELLSDGQNNNVSIKEAPSKNNRILPTMDELLSGEPIPRILNLGNLDPKGKGFRQNTRICHTDGIIPTETASGNTLVYIPARS